MKGARAVISCALVLLSVCRSSASAQGRDTGASATPPPSGTFATEEDKTLYTLGRVLGSRVAPLKLTPAEIDKILIGFQDAASGRKEQVPVETYGAKIEALLRSKASAGGALRKEADRAFAERAASERGAVALASGLVIKTLNPGTGVSPAATSKVKVQYEGRLTDGTVFDSSRQRAEPAQFHLSQVIACWNEGLPRMKVGEKAQLVCPASLAYGEKGRPPAIPPGATLVFDVELLDVEEGAPAMPPDHP